LVENTSGITKDKTEEIHAAFQKIADFTNLKPGLKIPLDEAAKIASHHYLFSGSPSDKPSEHHITYCSIASIQTAMDTYHSRNSRSTLK
jgi:hypothetical protein